MLMKVIFNDRIIIGVIIILHKTYKKMWIKTHKIKPENEKNEKHFG
jgi:hypothetical protein